MLFPILCCWIFGILDLCLALWLAWFYFTQGPSSIIVTRLGFLFFGLDLAAVYVARQLYITNHISIAAFVASIPLLVTIGIVLFLYFGLRKMRMF